MTDKSAIGPKKLNYGKLQMCQYRFVTHFCACSCPMVHTIILDPIIFSSDRKPTLKEIQKFVVPHALEIWEELGIELELDDDGAILDRIRQARNRLESKCCLDVLKEWLRGAGVEPKTWRNLLKCLEAMSHPAAERAIAAIGENILDGE